MTVIPVEQETSLNLVNPLFQDLETRNLSIVNLVLLDENPGSWHEFIVDFKSGVHFKQNNF